MTKTLSAIEDKINELCDDRIANDDDCLIGSLGDCLAELRLLLNCITIDDRLAAIDVLKDRLRAQVIIDANLIDEANGRQERWVNVYERENRTGY